MRSAFLASLLCALASVVVGCGSPAGPSPRSPSPPPMLGAPALTLAPTVLGDESVLNSVHVPYGVPTDADPSDDYLMDKGSYVLSYNPSRDAANWVGWRLRAEDLGEVDRQDDFRADPALPAAYYHVVPGDYVGSGFDRGHLCPSADRTRTVDENSSTFLMTNMHPQAPQLNRGPWKALEAYTRSLTGEGKVAYVLVGGLFGDRTLESGAAVPDAEYKVVIAVEEGVDQVTPDATVLAVIIPNDASVKGHKWQEYAVSIDDIEAKSGYDLLSKLEDDVEGVLEAQVFPQPRAAAH